MGRAVFAKFEELGFRVHGVLESLAFNPWGDIQPLASFADWAVITLQWRLWDLEQQGVGLYQGPKSLPLVHDRISKLSSEYGP